MARIGSNLDDVRRRNLSAVLERVHLSGGLSRAELTAATGLNRSTVAALVADLAERRLVVEGGPGATRRVGRPSLTVAPHPAPLAIAVNPEIDAIGIGVVGLGARVVHRVRRALGAIPGPEEAAAIIAAEIAALPASVTGGARLVGVGLAVPGLVRASDGVVRWAPHLDWTDVPFTALVARATGLRAVAANDAACAALAEHLFGAGRGADDIVYLNGGASGIGGSVIAGGRALGGSGGYAGEFGHNRPGVHDPDDRRTPLGELEQEVSRARLVEVLGVEPGDERALTDAALATADPVALGELGRQRRILSTALANAVNVLDPELIVLGGFLATLLETDRGDLRAQIAAQAIPAAVEGMRIEPAALGSDRLLIGAAQRVFAALIADPTGADPGGAVLG
ncbi:ROK family transcriptional regulator [Galbitalea sp. SE-J8]|uniref:ROK family transcriptional regulator n=1 Tax=Galbitalea sp. SE-J8 TaxID=3054952 RepID=UPI00259D0614|nr:ROK family transcriptional regulator [Galbitalea sp. SE-J8]MDM4762505.1 ROK family transcriptional regulator [Galbitalea sp. SE-J8]